MSVVSGWCTHYKNCECPLKSEAGQARLVFCTLAYDARPSGEKTANFMKPLIVLSKDMAEGCVVLVYGSSEEIASVKTSCQAVPGESAPGESAPGEYYYRVDHEMVISVTDGETSAQVSVLVLVVNASTDLLLDLPLFKSKDRVRCGSGMMGSNRLGLPTKVTIPVRDVSKNSLEGQAYFTYLAVSAMVGSGFIRPGDLILSWNHRKRCDLAAALKIATRCAPGHVVVLRKPERKDTYGDAIRLASLFSDPHPYSLHDKAVKLYKSAAPGSLDRLLLQLSLNMEAGEQTLKEAVETVLQPDFDDKMLKQSTEIKKSDAVTSDGRDVGRGVFATVALPESTVLASAVPGRARAAGDTEAEDSSFVFDVDKPPGIVFEASGPAVFINDPRGVSGALANVAMAFVGSDSAALSLTVTGDIEEGEELWLDYGAEFAMTQAS